LKKRKNNFVLAARGLFCAAPLPAARRAPPFFASDSGLKGARALCKRLYIVIVDDHFQQRLS